MWILKTIWNDGYTTKQSFKNFEEASKSIVYWQMLASNQIKHFKLKYRGDQNE